jgi:hypothetical protein
MSVDAITENFRGLTIDDDEWIDFHEWITHTRNDYKLSISSFLHSCNLDSSRSYYRNLVSRNGGGYRPSQRRGTVGQLFRHKISELKSLGTFNALKSDRDRDFKFSIADWRLDNVDFLGKNSIRDLSVRDSISDSKFILNVHELESNELPHSRLLEIIWQDNNISANFDIERITFHSIKCQMLHSESSVFDTLLLLSF